jgi:hypothetical protein
MAAIFTHFIILDGGRHAILFATLRARFSCPEARINRNLQTV